MQFLTNIGYAPLSFLWCGAIIVVLFLAGLRWEAVMSLVSVVGVVLLGMVVKDLVQRARPAADLVNVFSAINEFSFPSGHVLFYVGFLGFLGFLIYILAPHSWLRTLGLVIIVTMIALIGVARVYLGQHWAERCVGRLFIGQCVAHADDFSVSLGQATLFRASARRAGTTFSGRGTPVTNIPSQSDERQVPKPDTAHQGSGFSILFVLIITCLFLALAFAAHTTPYFNFDLVITAQSSPSKPRGLVPA